MKTTRYFPEFGLWRDPALLRALVTPATLLSARYEPVLRDLIGYGSLDLTFGAGEALCTVANVLIDPVPLSVRTSQSLVWPAFVVAIIEEDILEAIEATVLPWLRMLARGRALASEEIRHYGDPAPFEHARALGLFGAAPFAHSLPRLAPLVYAARFAAGARVYIAAHDTATAVAVIRPHAAAIAERPQTGADAAFARRWFALPEPAGDAGPYDLVIAEQAEDVLPGARTTIVLHGGESLPGARTVLVPEPVPLDVLFTFDAADAPAVASFAVIAHPLAAVRPRRVVDAPVAGGGSAGSIVFALRDDARFAPDADTDAIDAFAEWLRAEGLRVAVAAGPADPALAGADLVHIFGAFGDPHVRAYADSAAAAAVPFVLSCEPFSELTIWMEDTLPTAIRAPLDDLGLDYYLSKFEQRALIIDGLVPEASPEQLAAIDQRFLPAAVAAAGIIVSSDTDRARVRERFPALPEAAFTVAALPAGAEPAEDDIAAIVPDRPFVLVHAPIIRRSNLLFALWPLARAGIFTVIAGEVVDVNLLTQLRRIGGESTLILTDPAPGVVAALYRRAAVWLDASARPAGTARLMRAAQCGALPVVARTSPLAELTAHDAPVFEFPLFDSLAGAVRSAFACSDAPARARRIAERQAAAYEPGAAFRAVVALYAGVGARA